MNDTTAPSQAHDASECIELSNDPDTVVGEADATLDLDEDTYGRLYALYCQAVGQGFGEDFATFALSRVTAEWTVTVNGAAVDPGAYLDETDRPPTTMEGDA